MTRHILNKVFIEYGDKYEIKIVNTEHNDYSGSLRENYIILYDVEKSTSYDTEYSDDGEDRYYSNNYLITYLHFVKK